MRPLLILIRKIVSFFRQRIWLESMHTSKETTSQLFPTRRMNIYSITTREESIRAVD